MGFLSATCWVACVLRDLLEVQRPEALHAHCGAGATADNEEERHAEEGEMSMRPYWWCAVAIAFGLLLKAIAYVLGGR